MLHDQNKTGIYSLENFAAWLSQQPPQKTYNYCDPFVCPAAQYLRLHGVERFYLMPCELRALGWNKILNHYRMTFGAAANRAQWQLTKNKWRNFFGLGVSA